MRKTLAITMGVFLICTNFVFSQSQFLPSYIVTRQNDTIYGIGNVSNNQEYCLFKKPDAKDYSRYSPYDITIFTIIDGKKYISKEFTGPDGYKQSYFLEYLVDGELDLYSIDKSERYFIEKESDSLIELNYQLKTLKTIKSEQYMVHDKRYLGYIRAYMAEAPQLFTEIDKMKTLSQRKLVKLSVDYHNAVCTDYECVNYTKKIPVVTYKVELVSGAIKHNAHYSPQFGVLFHIWRPLISEKLYIKTGLLYSEKRAIKQRLDDRTDNQYSLRFPLSFQYVFGNNKLKPTVAVGWPTGIFLISSIQGGLIYSITDKWELTTSASLDGIISYGLGWHKDMYDNNFGHTVNFGIIYQL